jgi:hypothetical protein
MRSSVRLAGLLAGALMFSLASSARAEFSMQILNNDTGDGFKISENASHTAFTLTILGQHPSNVNVGSWSASTGVINAAVTVDNYTFDLQAKSNRTTPGDLGTVSFNGNVTTNAGATKTSFSYYTADNFFTSPGISASQMLLTSSVTSLGAWNNGDTTKSQTQYTRGVDGKPSTFYTTGYTGSVNGPNQSEQSTKVIIPSRGDRYALSDIGGITTSGQTVGGKIHFWSSAVTAMPEPTGVLIALLGVPCLGLVLLVARRRAIRFSAAA